MIGLLCFVLAVLAAPVKSKMRLEAENAVLRHQLTVLRRRLKGRVRLTNNDRWFLVVLYRWFPSILQVLTVIRPDTLIRWHRSGFRCYWRWKSRPVGGRPQIEAGLRALIRRMSMDNPLWGAPRIHGELLKLGFEVAQLSVATYMVKRRGPPSQGWRTFLRNHAPEIAAMDPDHPTPLAPSEDLSYELTPLDEAKRYGFIGICEIDAWNQQECEAWMRHNTAGGDEMTLTTRRLFRGSASPTRAWHVYVVPADRD
jgi:hypothetical protein